MAFQYLTQQALGEIQDALIDLGFADDDQLKALTSGIEPAYVGSFLTGGNSMGKLLTFTSRMNRTRVLENGDVPLFQFLRNAARMAGGTPERQIFQRALEIASPDGEAPSTTSPSVAQSTPTQDVAAIPEDKGRLEVVIDQDDTLLPPHRSGCFALGGETTGSATL